MKTSIVEILGPHVGNVHTIVVVDPACQSAYWWINDDKLIFTFKNFLILQFRALSDQIYNTPDRHKIVRRQVVHQVCFIPSCLIISDCSWVGRVVLYISIFHRSYTFFVIMVCNHQLKSHPEIYEGYVPMEYGDYLRKMSK